MHMIFLGKKVYRQMPKEVKRIIRENGELYRIGLHGPDIFFYYFIFKNHVSNVGYRMHKEKARAFLSRGWNRYGKRRMTAAFLSSWFWLPLSS